jgi:hypothetical protein
MILEKYATPGKIAAPISDSLFRAGTPIDAYKSVRSGFIPTPPPAPTFSPLLPTTGASGSDIHVKEEPPNGRRRRTKYSPPVVKKKAKRHSLISGDQTITTEKYYKGSLQFCNIHPSLTLLAITVGHLILGPMDELDALSKEADNKVRPEPLEKNHQVGCYLQRLGIMDDKRL